MIGVYDESRCSLGEGPLWHPDLSALFWCDINNRRILTRGVEDTAFWQMGEHVSALGRLGNRLFVAGETGLFAFDPASGDREDIVPLEAENPVTRSNDGRSDPWGGFWIGTMGKSAEDGAGTIYRFYRGEIRAMYGKITIPNAICFAPDGSCGYFADTATRQIWRQPLNQKDGWPKGDPEKFAQLPRPDGAVVDTAGNLWCANYGFGLLTCHDKAGNLIQQIQMPASQVTCPAFGGKGSSRMFVTSAAQGLSDPSPKDGQTFEIEADGEGQQEFEVIL